MPRLPQRSSVYELHSTGDLLIGKGLSVPLGPKPRLGEIYLELYALDLEDPVELLAFANRYGIPSGSLVHTALGSPTWFSPQDDVRARDTIIDDDPELQQPPDWTQPESAVAEIATLASFRFAASALRDLTNAWRLVSADATFEAATHEWELPYPEHESPFEKRFFALLLLGQLGRLLESFHPYVMPTPDPEWEAADDDEPMDGDLTAVASAGVDVEAARSTSVTHLAQVCALELFNHIAGSEVYRQCHNEACGRAFVCQYGRAELGQTRRQGVMYCSVHCSQAVASREYRRRKRAKSKSPTRHQEDSGP